MSEETYDVVVSFATHKARIEKGYLIQFMDRLVNQKFNGRFLVVANIWRPDYEDMPQELKDYMVNHGIQVVLHD